MSFSWQGAADLLVAGAKTLNHHLKTAAECSPVDVTLCEALGEHLASVLQPTSEKKKTHSWVTA